MPPLDKLPKWFESKPLVFLRFPSGFEQDLLESKHGLNRFTWAEPHFVFKELKLPTLCVVEMRSGARSSFYVGVVLSKAAVTTFDSRVTVIRLQTLKLPFLDALKESLKGKRLQNQLTHKLAAATTAIGLTPKLSVAIVEVLARDSDNRESVEKAASYIPGLQGRPTTQWEQLDAIKTAMAAFGLSKADLSEFVEVSKGSDSTINQLDSFEARVLEDNVIATDASVVPGFTLIEKYVTGRAVFVKGNERLDIYTANRGPLEEMLGVDLVYVNERVGSTVMVQYKMLEIHNDPARNIADWIVRLDRQFWDEIARMELPEFRGMIDDYRIHRDPFFFKFVRRTGDGHSHHSFILSLDHLNQLFASEEGKGPRGGVRVSFESLNGVYLRDSDFVSLIRSGYIGTHRRESDALHPIISEVASGNRGLVLAWQSLRKHSETPEINADPSEGELT